jgi:geranylgeranyl reductase family protein
MIKEYDVIIVGAGPAGSSFAYNLKRMNSSIRILLLDKSSFPRYKPCGGGVSPEIANYFDFSLEPVIDYVCNDVVMRAGGQDYITNKYPLWMVRREKFDTFIVEQAKNIGVEVITECLAEKLLNKANECILQTDVGDFKSKIIVLAHGSRGTLAKKCGYDIDNKIFAALEYEHYTKNQHGKLFVDFDNIQNGYAWNFPKSDGLSLGVGGVFKGSNIKVSLPNKLKEYISKFNVIKVDKNNLHGHPIEMYSGRKNLVNNRVILIGEIAGCVDPLTAEGIRPAVKSGYLAASVVNDYFKSNNLTTLKKYNKMFHKEIGSDLRYASIMAWFLYNYYDRVVSIIASNIAVHAFMSVFSGNSTYKEKIHFRRISSMLLKVILNR